MANDIESLLKIPGISDDYQQKLASMVAPPPSPAPSAAPAPAPMTAAPVSYNLPPQAPVEQPAVAQPVATGTGGLTLIDVPGQTKQTSTQDVPLDPSLTAPLSAASNKAIKAQEELTNAKVEQARIEAQGLVQQAKVRQEQDDKIQAITNRHQEETTAALKNVDSAITDAKNFKVDPNHYWASKSTGSQIGSAIALVLGGVGGALSGKGGNAALDIINRAVDRDLEAQAREGEAKQKLVGSAQNAYGLLREKIGDEKIAMLAGKNLALDRVENDVKAQQAKYNGPIAQAEGEKLIAGLQQAKAANQIEIAKQTQAKVVTERTLNPMLVNASTGAPVGARDNEKEVTSYGQAYDKDSAQKARAVNGEYDPAVSSLRELNSLTDKSGKALNPNDRAKAETISSIIKGQLRTPILGPGAVTDKERAILDSIVANPTAIFSLDAINRTRLNTLIERLEDQKNQKLKEFFPPETFKNKASTGDAKKNYGFTPIGVSK